MKNVTKMNPCNTVIAFSYFDTNNEYFKGIKFKTESDLAHYLYHQLLDDMEIFLDGDEKKDVLSVFDNVLINAADIEKTIYEIAEIFEESVMPVILNNSQIGISKKYQFETY